MILALIMNKYRFGWLVFIIIASMNMVFAQFVQKSRIEQPIVRQQNFRKVISLNESGALLVMSNPQITSRKSENLWEFICYDTSLGQRHSIRFGLPSLWRFKHYITKSAHILMIFDNPTSPDLFIYRLDLNNGEGENFNYYAPVNFVAEWFCYPSQDDFYIGGRHKYRPIAVHYNMQTHGTHIIPGLYDAQLVVKQQIENQNNSLTLVLERGNKGKEVILQTYGSGGHISSTIFWKMPKNYRINDIKPFLPSDIPRWICTFATGLRDSPQGFMILDSQGPKDINGSSIFKFIDFKNFFNHYKKQKKARIERRIARLRTKGKEYRMGYKFLLHTPIYKDSLVYVVADAYFPHYSYSSINNYGYANAGMNRSFDGYQFTHYLTCVFDLKSNLLWEYSGKASNEISFELEPNTCFMVSDSSRMLAFYHDQEQIYFNILLPNTKESTTQSFDVQGFDNTDESSETQDLSVTSWYGNYMLATGQQTIINQSQKDKPWVREVYFISKIGYQPGNKVVSKGP